MKKSVLNFTQIETKKSGLHKDLLAAQYTSSILFQILSLLRNTVCLIHVLNWKKGVGGDGLQSF